VSAGNVRHRGRNCWGAIGVMKVLGWVGSRGGWGNVTSGCWIVDERYVILTNHQLGIAG